jgi:PIN domain nuclease of toxin-antitoxin system
VRLLLDTHALLWWLDGDRRLSLKARRAMANQSNTILVSAASAWEITTKARLGKLPGADDVAADVAACVASQGFQPLDITIPHATCGTRQRFAPTSSGGRSRPTKFGRTSSSGSLRPAFASDC